MSLKQSSISNSYKNNGKSIEICDSFTSSDQINSKKEDNISLIEDSTDGLQWFTELDYQYKRSDECSGYCHSVPKSIFESSLVVSSNSFITPPTSNYSNELDVNLAQIDIETFKSEDINTLFLQQAGEECCPPLSRSLFEDSISSNSFRSLNGAEEQNDLSFDESKDINEDIDEEVVNRRTTDLKTGANDISVDSLDMSLLQKCTKRDKNNYTIVFEGSITASQELSGSEQERRLSLLNRNGLSKSNYLSNEVNDRKMTKSERFLPSLHKSQTYDRINRNLNHRSDLLIEEIDESISRLTQSIPDVKALLKMNGNYRMPVCPVSGFIPLYDLQSSQSSNSHSSGSEFSPPRSLVKMFMQNRSPLSSQPISPSLSYESRSQDSGAGNTSDSSFRPIYYNILELSRETNNNTLFENRNLGSAKDDSPSYDDNLAKTRIRLDSHRIPFDLKQTFPIKEVDENLSDSTLTDIHMSSFEGNDTTPIDLNRNPVKSHSNSKTFINSKEFDYYSKQFGKNQNREQDVSSQSFETQFNEGIQYCSRNTNIGTNRRTNPKMSNTRPKSTQYPSNFQDKEVQASIPMSSNQMPINMTPLMTPESPNDCNKPFYIYYPNYSLPDLSFLEQILEKHSNCGPKTVYISPTKHQLPEKETVSVRMRRNTKSKSRPKSYTDFETLSKQNFSHIKDWDSLNILLPNEFKELIQKANNVSNTENQTPNEKISNDFNPSVRMRSHRSSGQVSDNSLYSRRGYKRNKRYSLQEYTYSQINETQTDCHNISHNIEHNSCITRSQTMPNCHNACHCHQHCCHSCCHSCCRTPRQSPSSSAFQTLNCDPNTHSIDKLCQLLAMDLSFKKLMNIINGQTVGPQKRTNFETLPETKEEKLSDSDITLNPNLKPNVDNFTQKQTENQTPNKEGLHFKELKQRWESLAAFSPTDVKPVVGTVDKNSTTVSENNKRLEKSSEELKNRVKPEIARKPHVVLRRPQSSIPRPTSLNTENTTYNHRKSLIPVPKAGLKSPVNYTSKLKTNIGSKNNKL